MINRRHAILMMLGAAVSGLLLTGCQTTGEPLPTALTGDTDKVQQNDELERIARGHRYEN